MDPIYESTGALVGWIDGEFIFDRLSNRCAAFLNNDLVYTGGHLALGFLANHLFRDMLGNAMEAYLSVVANRTGDVTKQLTIFATIFLPLSFIVGFFGQNFEVLANDIFLIPMFVSITVLPVGTVLWFRRLGWL